MSQLAMRRAKGAHDVETVVTMWVRAARWLAQRGLDQWQYPVKRHNIEAKIRAGELWLAEDETGRVIATVTVDDDADSKLWRPEDSPEDALYVHRLVVEPEMRGGEIGSAILDWVGQRAANRSRPWVRLDAWTSNDALHKYYLDRGFSLVRIIDLPDYPSGVLLQRPASYRRGVGPTVISAPAGQC